MKIIVSIIVLLASIFGIYIYKKHIPNSVIDYVIYVVVINVLFNIFIFEIF